jgi:hypothetical protein
VKSESNQSSNQGNQGLELNENLAKLLAEYDDAIDLELADCYASIELKSKALANSLRRCFREARESKRFEAAYKAGLEKKYEGLSENEIIELLNKEFEEEDFMIFREFVRLLRACSLHISGEISGKIKEKYKHTLKQDRLLLFLRAGETISCFKN